MPAASAIFTAYIEPVIVREGDKYTNNPLDHGGPTRWGITEARARAARYEGRMQDLTREQAIEIYRLFYWTQPMFDQVVPIVPLLAAYMLDIGVNQGTSRPGRYAQRALNVLNNGGSQYADINEDGVFGAMSRAALQSFIQRRGVEGASVMLDMVKAQASVKYIEIAEGNKSQEVWEWGWQKRAFQVTA